MKDEKEHSLEKLLGMISL